ncbi:YSC84-related protein [Sneathiella limimaris]|uniref:lipid-binding SYLF domain-containing protein n=1 Tax=Sneathiella limimaris TaxID=1964213 RepID=UPI003B839E80
MMMLAVSGPSVAATAENLKADAEQASNQLERTSPVAAHLAKNAKATLIFPNVVKAGLVFGGAYGEGLMMKGGLVDGYYNTVTGSWGFQVGAQTYGYIVYLMSDKAIKYVAESKGWELGVGPTVVVIDAGAAKNLSTSSLKEDAYAFIFDQKGLMAGISIEGTKISLIAKP